MYVGTCIIMPARPCVGHCFSLLVNEKVMKHLNLASQLLYKNVSIRLFGIVTRWQMFIISNNFTSYLNNSEIRGIWNNSQWAYPSVILSLGTTSTVQLEKDLLLSAKHMACCHFFNMDFLILWLMMERNVDLYMVLTIPEELGDSGKTPKWHPDRESAGSNARIT